MVNFGPLAAEIGLPVWGNLANFNGFRILAVLLHGSQVVGVSQTAALNRGHQLCSAGRPSHWSLSHILVGLCITAGEVMNMCIISACFAVNSNISGIS